MSIRKDNDTLTNALTSWEQQLSLVTRLLMSGGIQEFLKGGVPPTHTRTPEGAQKITTSYFTI